MGGFRSPGTANDSAYGVLILLTYLSILFLIPLLITYIVLIVMAFTKKEVEKEGEI